MASLVSTTPPESTTARIFQKSPETDDDKRLQAKEASKVLRGLIKQVTLLKDFQLPFGINDELALIEEQINIANENINYQKKPKNESLDTLNGWDQEIEEILEKLNNIKSELMSVSDNNKQASDLEESGNDDEGEKEELPALKEKVDDIINNRKELMPTIKEESDRLNIQNVFASKYPKPSEHALSCLTVRLKSIIPDYAILDQLRKSEEKDESRQEQYENLKKVWKTFSVKCKQAENLVKQLEFALAVQPTIRPYENELETLKKTTKVLLRAFEEISPHKIVEGFDPKAEKSREFEPLLKSFTSSQYKLTEIAKLNKSYNQLNQNIIEFMPTINSTLENISSSLKTLSKDAVVILKGNNKTIEIKLEDDAFTKEITQERISARQTLVVLENKIVLDWNQICYSLNKMQHELSKVERLKALVERLSLSFLKAENIYTTLRNTRKTCPNRNAHKEVFEEQLKKFSELSTAICDLNGSNPEKTNLKYQFKKVIEIENPQDIEKLGQAATEEEARQLGLVWTSDETKEKAIALLNQDKRQLKTELLLLDATIKEAYSQTLPKIFTLAVKELNTMGKTLEGSNSRDTTDFTKAYLPENPVGKLVSGLSLGWSSSKQDETSEKFVHTVVKSPFDLG